MPIVSPPESPPVRCATQFGGLYCFGNVYLVAVLDPQNWKLPQNAVRKITSNTKTTHFTIILDYEKLKRDRGQTLMSAVRNPRPRSSVTPSRVSLGFPSAWPRPTCPFRRTPARRAPPRDLSSPLGTSGRRWGQGSSTPWWGP